MKAKWAKLPRWLRRTLVGLASALAALVVIMAATIGITETACRAPSKLAATATPQPRMAPADRRDEVNSYLTYPEWSIVYAYDDLAGVMRAGSESDFGYVRSIRGFWSGLCGVKKEASARGPISFDYNSMLYTIGVSFTAEMGVKGLYETTLGRVTAWIRGATRTPEDEFALKTADEYAAFLRQVPWYEFPFGQKLRHFWADTPLLGGNAVRKIERRFALTLEYGSKAIYAQVIKALAGLSPAPLRIRSIVRKMPPNVDNRISTVGDLGQDMRLIETPRYQEFTDIIAALAATGSDFVEIAGNSNILVTTIAKAGAPTDPALARTLFNIPIQSRPGFVRIGYDVRVGQLCDFIRGLASAGLMLEHVYDY